GKAPFHGSDPAATVARIVSDPAPPMRSLRPELPEALDRVVLRGLERDPERRWHDLDTFERALRAFLPHQLSIVGLGVRFGAYLIDHFLLMVLSNTVTLTLLFLRDDLGAIRRGRLERSVGYQLLAAMIFWVYFAVPEAFWGCSLGKRWLRLRVVGVSSAQPPG